MVRPPLRRGCHGAALAAALCLLAPAGALAQETLESPIKATFLYRFADFVGWPPGVTGGPGDPLNICIVGRDVFGEVIDQAVAGQSAAGRALAVYRLAYLDVDSACHIAYIAGSEEQSVDAALAVAQDAPLLTVTDEANGETRGMVHFELVDDRVRFHIDEAEASARGLTVNSRLLNIAVSVKRRPQ
jgi:hypothetical protein